MHRMFTNATVRWRQHEIEAREALMREIPSLISHTWRNIRPIIRLERVETPCLTPASELTGHIETGFDLMPARNDATYLRPETTAGTFQAFRDDWPHKNQWPKILPLCYWQAGKSFRDEKKGDTMRATRLRLREFWQMEFQLFCLPDTKVDYLEPALKALTNRYGGQVVEAAELPHYSKRTLDWEIEGLEVAGCSLRTDFEGLEVFEIAIGLDRLVALLTR